MRSAIAFLRLSRRAEAPACGRGDDDGWRRATHRMVVMAIPILVDGNRGASSRADRATQDGALAAADLLADDGAGGAAERAANGRFGGGVLSHDGCDRG